MTENIKNSMSKIVEARNSRIYCGEKSDRFKGRERRNI